MANKTLNVTLIMRNDTAANWASKNSVLSAGEFGYDTTNKVLKIGDGTTAWANLVALKTEGGGASIAIYAATAAESEKAVGYTRGGEIDAEFKKMDKNNDGQISKDEYMEAMIAETMRKYEAAFKQIDQDGDDNISKQEYEDFMNFATNKIHQMMQAINK